MFANTVLSILVGGGLLRSTQPSSVVVLRGFELACIAPKHGQCLTLLCWPWKADPQCFLNCAPGLDWMSSLRVVMLACSGCWKVLCRHPARIKSRSLAQGTSCKTTILLVNKPSAGGLDSHVTWPFDPMPSFLGISIPNAVYPMYPCMTCMPYASCCDERESENMPPRSTYPLPPHLKEAPPGTRRRLHPHPDPTVRKRGSTCLPVFSRPPCHSAAP